MSRQRFARTAPFDYAHATNLARLTNTIRPRARRWLLLSSLLSTAWLASQFAAAQPSPRASASTGSQQVAPSPSGARSAPVASAAMPPGHPPLDDEGPPEGAPPGHPAVGHGDQPRFKMPSQSEAREDTTVPAGSIVVEARGPDGAPLPRVEVMLGVVESSVAKGESRQRQLATTDEQGKAVFAGQKTDSAFSYRVSVTRDGATYAAAPFNLSQTAGHRAVIVVYPVTKNVREATVAAQGILYVELKDEVLQIEQAYRVFNLGQITWLPTGEEVRLPEGFKAFNAQKVMSDVGWDGSKAGARLRGTFSPGVHDTAYRYQVAYDGDEMTLDLGLMPNVQSYRVIVEAPKGLTLEVEGFPAAQQTVNGNGQRILFTEKETQRLDTSFRQVKVRLGNIPQKPAGRWVAVGLATAAALGGLWLALSSKRDRQAGADQVAEARKRLLDELEALEKAKAAGEVGPKTYEQARRALVEALARVVVREETM